MVNNMSSFMVYRLFHLAKNSMIPIQHTIQTRCYAAPRQVLKKTKKISVVTEKKQLPVETDVNRLLTYVCGSNIYKEGGEDVKIKPDSEYPSWLWTIRTGPAPPLEELDPNTKQYWRRIRLFGLKRNNKEKGTKKF